MAHNHGLDEAKVREVPRWRESAVFTALERRVMEYAEAASQTPPAVTDELSDALLAEIGPAALVELAARVAFMNMSARMNIALGIHSEEFAAACGLPPLAEAGGRCRPRVGSPGMSSDARADDDPFVVHRGLLFTVAYELLGSAADAEDVLQESWLRWATVDHARSATPAPIWFAS